MKAALLISFFFFISITCVAQLQKADTAFLSTAVATAKNTYTKSLRGAGLLFNGAEYVEYVSKEEEHPFFLSNDWLPGSIVYDGELYKNVSLLFDISNDKVITDHETSGNKIQLINSKIDRFTIGEHHFIKLEKNITDSFSAKPGFFEVLYTGNVSVLAKRSKMLQERISSGKIIAFFEEGNRYYFLKDGKYLPVKGKKSALLALSDKQNALKQQLKKNRIRFRHNHEQALVQTATLYNNLNNQ